MAKLLSNLTKGAWSSVVAYTIGDIVNNSGGSYICIKNHTNQEPPNATYWALLSEKGDTGVSGVAGDTGITGATGVQGDTGVVSIAGGYTVINDDTMAAATDNNIPTADSVKNYVDNNPYGGWLTAGLDGVSVSRDSIDDPTVVLTFDADVTDYIWKGSRIKLTEGGTTHYMIVSADPVYSDPNTTVTCLMEIDTTTPTQAADPVDSGTITNVAYAPPKTYPKGFPISPENWTMRIDNLTQHLMSSGGVWDTATPLTINLAVGSWRVLGNVNWMVRTETTGHYYLQFSFQDDEGTPSDQEVFYLRRHYFQSTGSSGQLEGIAILDRHIQITSKTTFYTRGNDQSDNVFRINNAGLAPESFVRATSTLL